MHLIVTRESVFEMNAIYLYRVIIYMLSKINHYYYLDVSFFKYL